MIHRESTGAHKAGYLLAIGAAFGIVGLLLSAGSAAATEVVFQDASRPVLELLVWGPRLLLGAGCLMAAISGVAISVGWIHRGS